MSEAPSSLELIAARRTVLVVDDHPTVCASIAYYLEYCGFRALRAESGARAIEIARQELVDCVLLDVQMRGMDGFEACRQLVAQANGRPLPVWFITSTVTSEIRESATKAGGMGAFQKPFDWPQLLRAIEGGPSIAAAASPP